MAQVTVLYFGVLRERRGTTSEVVRLDGPTTAAALYARLFPPGPGGALPVGHAVNAAHVPADTVLCDGDEVAFLPPVGGG